MQGAQGRQHLIRWVRQGGCVQALRRLRHTTQFGAAVDTHRLSVCIRNVATPTAIILGDRSIVSLLLPQWQSLLSALHARYGAASRTVAASIEDARWETGQVVECRGGTCAGFVSATVKKTRTWLMSTSVHISRAANGTTCGVIRAAAAPCVMT
jgi:hypothetical protein